MLVLAGCEVTAPGVGDDAGAGFDAARPDAAQDGALGDGGAPWDAHLVDAASDDASLDAALPPLEEGELLPGGDTTTSVVDGSAFLQQAANLTIARRADFEAGLQFFRLEWEIAPGRPEADGLGPVYNAVSCIECHVRNGRGAPSATPDENRPGVLLRLGTPDGRPDPTYGDQLQPLGVPGVAGEGHARRFESLVSHRLADGTQAMLPLPRYDIASLGYGPLAGGAVLSPRIAQQLVGQGLLEAIDEDDLLALADELDADADGISGRVRWIDALRIGRFGWKAGQPTVEEQTSAAFAGDLGITSSVHPTEACTESQAACLGAASGGSPELTATRLRVASSYVRLLGVPARRDAEAPSVRRGRVLFAAVGCDGCHRPSFVTGDSVEPELAGQRIWPYTDLLLHDMGERLADGRAEGDASGREWRTAPLWGIGLLGVVGGEVRLLHDGRARGVAEAVLWHDGEATAARLGFESLTELERADLVSFVESL
ncbi:Hypothetical protein I5071_48500 [Sandaracinus amylolyticus]|nr:Hypothetical protein I5071_48500 [Sandaracinus amylolyticus]